MSSPDPRCSITVAYADFLLALESAGRSAATLSYYRCHLRPFLTYLTEHQIDRVTNITVTDCRRFLTERQQNVVALTAHHDAACMRAFCNHLVGEDVLTVSPMRTVKLPRVEERIPEALTPEQVQAILKAASTTRNKAIILMLLDTGLRASEFVAVNVGDVDLISGAVLVRHTKIRKQRMVYIGTRARRALTLYLAQRPAPHTEQPLFMLDTEERLTTNALRLLLKRIASKTGIAACHPHTFRRTFALWSLRAGMNVYVLQRLMGHTDLTMLRRYLPLVENDLAKAHQEHGAVDQML